MSFSITTSDVIRKHPGNNSTSKEIHQFAKTPRFLSPNPECPNAFYSYNSELSKRTSSFGYGNKSDFTRDLTSSPPVTKYSLKTFVENTAKQGNAFGTGREELPDRSYLIPQLHKIPGPGQYDNQKKKVRNYSYTTRAKPVDMINSNLTYKKSPGPGTHTELDFHPRSGRFSVSKYDDHKLCKINSGNERFKPVKQSPGPSSYREGDSINGEAKYVLSNRRSNGKRLFSKTARDGLWKTTITPGPGSYTQLSEFGHYANAQYYKTLNK